MRLILALSLLVIFTNITAQTTAVKSHTLGVQLGSSSFKDGLVSLIRYDMPLFGLAYNRQKISDKRLNYSGLSVNYATQSNTEKFFQQSVQTNFRFGRLFRVAKNLYVGGEPSLVIHARFSKQFRDFETGTLTGNALLNLNASALYFHDFERKKDKIRLFNHFSTTVLGFAASGGGNQQVGVDPIMTFSALTRFYRFQNTIGVDVQKNGQKKAWQIAFNWEFTTFKTPIYSQFGNSSILLMRKF
jgi:hypothetical protein